MCHLTADCRLPSKGYSLMELLAIISIVSVFVSFVGQAADNFYSAQTVAASARTFVEDVRRARYGSMADQRYYRLFFSADGFGYAVQVYDEKATIDPGDFLASLTDINSAKWGNVIDLPIREFDPEINFQKPAGLTVMFFRYDGLLVSEPSTNAAPLRDYIATFSYGSSVLTVNISAAGVMASEEYYEPD